MTGPRYVNPSTRHNGGQVIVVPQGGGSTQVVTPEEPVEVLVGATARVAATTWMNGTTQLNLVEGTTYGGCTVANNEITVSAAGLYMITFTTELDNPLALNNTSTSRWVVYVDVNGASRLEERGQIPHGGFTASTGKITVGASGPVMLAAGDKISVRMYTNFNTSPGYSAGMSGRLAPDHLDVVKMS